MDAFLKPIEQALMPFFKGLPALPENGKKMLVKYWPYLALVFGVLQLFAVWGLWGLGHVANMWVDRANELSLAAGYGVVTPHLGITYYVGLASLVVDGIILLMAYAPLKAHKKQGWDLLLLGSLLNLVYGVIMVFNSSYGGFGSLFGALLGSAIGLYFLFQVRDYYTGAKSTTQESTSPQSTTTASTSTKPKQ